MGRNRRMKIKEHLEGCHKLTEAYRDHCYKVLAMIGEESPVLAKAITQLDELAQALDEFTLRVYATT